VLNPKLLVCAAKKLLEQVKSYSIPSPLLYD
jgi:hypothetical protein